MLDIIGESQSIHERVKLGDTSHHVSDYKKELVLCSEFITLRIAKDYSRGIGNLRLDKINYLTNN